MTDELRIEIAKLKGWEVKDVLGKLYRIERVKNHPCGNVQHGYHLHPSLLPDWPHSIADAYALEDEIPDEESRSDYTIILRKVILKEKGWRTDFDYIHATPEQRCRAWVMWRALA